MTEKKADVNLQEIVRFAAWTLAADSDMTVIIRYSKDAPIQNIRLLKQVEFNLNDTEYACARTFMNSVKSKIKNSIIADKTKQQKYFFPVVIMDAETSLKILENTYTVLVATINVEWGNDIENPSLLSYPDDFHQTLRDDISNFYSNVAK